MRIEKDGIFYRLRRGKLVEIPSEWVGKVPMNWGKQRKVFSEKIRRNIKRKDNKIIEKEREFTSVDINIYNLTEHYVKND